MVRIVITEADQGMAEGIRSSLTGGDFEIVGYARDGLEAAQMAMRLQPHVLLVHENLPGVSGYRASELVNAATPDVAVVLVVATASEDILRRAMISGARAVIERNAPADQFAETVRQIAGLRDVKDDPEYPLVTDPERMPQSIAVTSAKGGSGKTTVAVNLAVSFANRFPDKVVLVDFHGQFGDASLALDLAPHGTLVDLASFDELDPELVETHLTTHSASSLRLLAAPEVEVDPVADMQALNVPFMAALIGILRRGYRFVFFDIPPLVWPTSRYVFSRCQELIVVTNLCDLASIRDTKSLVDLAAASVGDDERVHLVVNRASHGGEYSTEDLEKTTGRKVYAELPDDFATASGDLNAGIPVVLESPNTALAKALESLAAKLQQAL